MIPGKLRHETVRSTIIEFVLIVLGVLVALAVDQWRDDRKQEQFLTQQLESLVSEIDANLDTITRVRELMIPRKLTALEKVIATLDSPDPHINDLDGFLKEFAYSTLDSKVWFTRNRYDALRSSGSFRIIGNRKIEDELSDTYDGVSILLSQATAIGAGYPALVQQLITARYQRTLNNLATYVDVGIESPGVMDNQEPRETINSIINERKKIIRLARGEVATATAKWYALSRIKAQFENLKSLLLAHPALKYSNFNVNQPL